MKNKSICILVTLIAACAIYIRMTDEVIKYNNYFAIDNVVKYVDSDILDEVVGEVEIVEEQDTDKEIENAVTEEVITKDVVEVITSGSSQVIEKVEESVIDTPVSVETQNEVITGAMSGYGPDCSGCSGYVSYGMYVGGGNIYYNDSEYGMVRIVAGDKSYKFGTIVRINDSMLAIVLDRGGSIGIGKKFLFDLLYESEAEASKYGVSYNTKFEILRNGF